MINFTVTTAAHNALKEEKDGLLSMVKSLEARNKTLNDYKPANIDNFARAIYKKQCDYVGADHEGYCVGELKTALQSMESHIESLEALLKGQDMLHEHNTLLVERNKELQEVVDRLTTTFQHTHSAVGKEDGDDSCAECGLDLRNRIHHRNDK